MKSARVEGDECPARGVRRRVSILVLQLRPLGPATAARPPTRIPSHEAGHTPVTRTSHHHRSRNPTTFWHRSTDLGAADRVGTTKSGGDATENGPHSHAMAALGRNFCPFFFTLGFWGVGQNFLETSGNTWRLDMSQWFGRWTDEGRMQRTCREDAAGTPKKMQRECSEDAKRTKRVCREWTQEGCRAMQRALQEEREDAQHERGGQITSMPRRRGMKMRRAWRRGGRQTRISAKLRRCTRT